MVGSTQGVLGDSESLWSVGRALCPSNWAEETPGGREARVLR